ncbi:hypothetical protein [Nocardia iowensis]|uniref:Uncharacterized protein n=1 Tax=Nocardia iowensis TaxID=204891 RepID=A0ABX8RY89_NOCIO|nr:hypothetical protein [Nocardia iowensis]QXN94613.1 hypothetical protein KV110_17100 [Nocardia iowensis]
MPTADGFNAIVQGGESRNGAPADSFVRADGEVVALLDAGVAEPVRSHPVILRRHRIAYGHITAALNLPLPFTQKALHPFRDRGLINVKGGRRVGTSAEIGTSRRSTTGSCRR